MTPLRAPCSMWSKTARWLPRRPPTRTAALSFPMSPRDVRLFRGIRPGPFAKLQQPVIAHVDQATVDGGGTVSVTAVDQMLPTSPSSSVTDRRVR